MDARAEMFDLVKTLSELPGPTGHEDAVQDWLAERWAATRETSAGRGSATCWSKSAARARASSLVAHADEIGLMVKSISDEGFLHVWPYGNDTSGIRPTGSARSTSPPWSSPAPAPSKA